MPIPTWSVIADNEIDPESPITTSLMFRLRDNVLAVLGIDPADPAPVFTIPPSTERAELASSWYASGSSGALTAAEQIVSVIDDDVEWIELGHDAFWQNVTASYNVGGVCPHVGSFDGITEHGIFYAMEVTLVDVLYSAGVPTGVRVVVNSKEHTGSFTFVREVYDVTITLANTWQTIFPNMGSTSSDFQGKARATSTEVYLQLRITGAIDQTDFIDIPFNRRSFKSKAAV
jgi:hypothetical protein